MCADTCKQCTYLFFVFFKKVVKDVLVALANQDVYYRVFNDFVRTNPEFLEQNDEGLLHETWRGILDFDNKKRWFKKKLYNITYVP